MTCSWMRKSFQYLLVAAATVVPPTDVQGVLYGDEIYQDVKGGKFWTFYRGGVAIIDPESCEIETNIVKDHVGDTLPEAFNDAVYMQSKDDSEGYVLVGSRVDEENDLGDMISHMYAFSTTERKAISKAEVGPRVVHSYAVWPQGEFWMHSDGNGLFYVFDIDDLSQVEVDDLEAKVDDPNHGKLLWDESPKLKDRGFGTSTGEQYLFEFDLKSKEQTAAYDYSAFNIEGCKGLHAIAYSTLNEHVYAECSGGGGALEFDVSNDSIQFVQQFPDANGALYETPDGQYVVASSKGMDALFLFVPQGTGNKSSVGYKIPMTGHPSTVSFYTNSDDKTIACSPMTENLNQNQRREDGTVACGYYEGCTGAVTADDVENGMCLHGNTEEDALKLFRTTSTTDVTEQNMSNVCARCQDESNFETNEETGEPECVCTPHCGSCDPSPAYSDNESGYMCINLTDFVDNADPTNIDAKNPIEGTVIGSTGGMISGSPYGSSAECTFGRTYRTHKRGMQYDAAVSNIPTDSLVIIDMNTMTKKCTVELPGSPRKVLYAPNEPVKGVVSGIMGGTSNDMSGGDMGGNDEDSSASTTFSTSLIMSVVVGTSFVVLGSMM